MTSPAARRLSPPDAGLALAWCLPAAIRCGLLPHLARAEAPVRDPAADLSLHAEAVERVLAVLQTHDWVERRPAGWSLAEHRLGESVDPASPAPPSAVLRHIDAFLQDGRVVPTHRSRVVRHDAELVGALGELFADAALHLAERLPVTPGPILDLGAGSAVWSLAQAAAHPTCRVVALDRAEILPAAVERARRDGLAKRLELLPGSFWTVPLPPVPRVVIASVLHLLSPADCVALIQRAAGAVLPGGSLVLIDVDEARDADEARRRSAYALHLRMREPHGVVHSPEQLAAWTEAGGLPSPVRLRLDHPRMGLVALVATRSRDG